MLSGFRVEGFWGVWDVYSQLSFMVAKGFPLGSCQNYGPCSGSYYDTAPII